MGWTGLRDEAWVRNHQHHDISWRWAALSSGWEDVEKVIDLVLVPYSYLHFTVVAHHVVVPLTGSSVSTNRQTLFCEDSHILREHGPPLVAKVLVALTVEAD